MKDNNFFNKVYETVKRIPEGRVMTCGQIADILGTKDARKVGYALHGNTNPDVPCHRVVNKEGSVAVNYAGGWREQKMRLSSEGVSFKNEMHVDMSKCHWENY